MRGRHFPDTSFVDLEAYFNLANHVGLSPRRDIAPQADEGNG